MSKSRDHEYILSFLDYISYDIHIRNEIVSIVMDFTVDRARQVADILRSIDASHLPMLSEVIEISILGDM